MRLPRLLILLVGIGLILGLMLWLVDALYRLYIQIAFTTPLLANLLLLLLIVLLVALIAAFVYYVGLFQRPQRRSQRRRLAPKVPAEKAEAAGETLRAVRRQVTQIQDEVARQARRTCERYAWKRK